MLTILEVRQMLRNVGITAILLLLPVSPLRAGMEPGNSAPLTVTSPDGNVSISFELTANPQPSLPEQEALGRFTLAAENTGFYFAREAYAYALNLGSYTTSYEGDYRRVSLDRIKPASIVALPLLIEMAGGPWAALLEADLTDYAGMYAGGVLGVP